ncbi:MAG TPA: hemerythrin domain-containing protein [Burkholderiaceae bacterium]|nr:hemerythrin domain-containing protein [Burkholderiaceae bacterium]
MKEPMQAAIDVIRGEHRALAAVMEAIKTLVADADGPDKIDFRLLWTMLYYIEAYPDRLHHPKEEQFIFSRLRERSPAAVALIDELHRQHEAGADEIAQLRTALGHFEAGVPGAQAALRAAVQRYAEQMWAHMTTEEQQLLPLAQSHLTPDDWKHIAQAFADNNDPVLGRQPQAELLAVFRRIVDWAPAPLGFGGHVHKT